MTWSAHRAGHLETHEDPHHESQHTFTAPFRPHAPDNPVTRIASLSAFSELSRHPGRLSWSALHVLSFLVIQKVLGHDSLESHRQFSRRHHPPRRSLPQHPRRPISAGSENSPSQQLTYPRQKSSPSPLTEILHPPTLNVTCTLRLRTCLRQIRRHSILRSSPTPQGTTYTRRAGTSSRA